MQSHWGSNPAPVVAHSGGSRHPGAPAPGTLGEQPHLMFPESSSTGDNYGGGGVPSSSVGRASLVQEPGDEVKSMDPHRSHVDFGDVVHEDGVLGTSGGNGRGGTETPLTDVGDLGATAPGGSTGPGAAEGAWSVTGPPSSTGPGARAAGATAGATTAADSSGPASEKKPRLSHQPLQFYNAPPSADGTVDSNAPPSDRSVPEGMVNERARFFEHDDVPPPVTPEAWRSSSSKIDSRARSRPAGERSRPAGEARRDKERPPPAGAASDTQTTLADALRERGGSSQKIPEMAPRPPPRAAPPQTTPVQDQRPPVQMARPAVQEQENSEDYGTPPSTPAGAPPPSTTPAPSITPPSTPAAAPVPEDHMEVYAAPTRPDRRPHQRTGDVHRTRPSAALASSSNAPRSGEREVAAARRSSVEGPPSTEVAFARRSSVEEPARSGERRRPPSTEMQLSADSTSPPITPATPLTQSEYNGRPVPLHASDQLAASGRQRPAAIRSPRTTPGHEARAGNHALHYPESEEYSIKSEASSRVERGEGGGTMAARSWPTTSLADDVPSGRGGPERVLGRRGPVGTRRLEMCDEEEFAHLSSCDEEEFATKEGTLPRGRTSSRQENEALIMRRARRRGEAVEGGKSLLGASCSKKGGWSSSSKHGDVGPVFCPRPPAGPSSLQRGRSSGGTRTAEPIAPGTRRPELVLQNDPGAAVEHHWTDERWPRRDPNSVDRFLEQHVSPPKGTNESCDESNGKAAPLYFYNADKWDDQRGYPIGAPPPPVYRTTGTAPKEAFGKKRTTHPPGRRNRLYQPHCSPVKDFSAPAPGATRAVAQLYSRTADGGDAELPKKLPLISLPTPLPMLAVGENTRSREDRVSGMKSPHQLKVARTSAVRFQRGVPAQIVAGRQPSKRPMSYYFDPDGVVRRSFHPVEEVGSLRGNRVTCVRNNCRPSVPLLYRPRRHAER